jgi:hypothetical protein
LRIHILQAHRRAYWATRRLVILLHHDRFEFQKWIFVIRISFFWVQRLLLSKNL